METGRQTEDRLSFSCCELTELIAEPLCHLIHRPSVQIESRLRQSLMICVAVRITDQICGFGDDAKFKNRAVIQLHTKLSVMSL